MGGVEVGVGMVGKWYNIEGSWWYDIILCEGGDRKSTRSVCH